MAKELLMTERTYHQDMSIIMNHFREFMSADAAANATLQPLYDVLQPIFDEQNQFNDALEKRLANCDNKITENVTVNIGDIVCDHFQKLEVSEIYVPLN